MDLDPRIIADGSLKVNSPSLGEAEGHVWNQSPIFFTARPCRRGPRAALLSKRDNHIGFVGQLRCKRWSCPGCIGLRRQFAAASLHCGLLDGVRSSSIEEYGTSSLIELERTPQNYKVAPLAPPASFHVAEYSNKEWQRITNRKGWRRQHPPYWSARYDDGYLVIAAGELPGGATVTPEGAMQRGLAWLASMRPDVTMTDGSVKTHERLCRPSPSWPRPDRAYHIGQFQMIGLVPAQKEEILNSLNSWRYVRPGLASSMAVTEWQQLPQGFRWFIEYHLHVLSPWEILVLFRGMGLRPHRGETEEEMERRIYSLFDAVLKAA